MAGEAGAQCGLVRAGLVGLTLAGPERAAWRSRWLQGPGRPQWKKASGVPAWAAPLMACSLSLGLLTPLSPLPFSPWALSLLLRQRAPPCSHHSLSGPWLSLSQQDLSLGLLLGKRSSLPPPRAAGRSSERLWVKIRVCEKCLLGCLFYF